LTKQQEGVRPALDLRLYNQRPYQQLGSKTQVSSLVTTSTPNQPRSPNQRMSKYYTHCYTRQ